MTPGLIHDYIGGTQKNKGETIKRDEKKEKYKESHFGKCRANCLLVIRKVPIHLPLADPLKKMSVRTRVLSWRDVSERAQRYPSCSHRSHGFGLGARFGQYIGGTEQFRRSRHVKNAGPPCRGSMPLAGP